MVQGGEVLSLCSRKTPVRSGKGRGGVESRGGAADKRGERGGDLSRFLPSGDMLSREKKWGGREEKKEVLR